VEPAGRGKQSDSIYFIASGEVEVRLPEPIHLGPGEFFGELVLLAGE